MIHQIKQKKLNLMTVYQAIQQLAKNSPDAVVSIVVVENGVKIDRPISSISVDEYGDVEIRYDENEALKIQ